MTLSVLRETAEAGDNADDNSTVVESTSALLHNTDVIGSDSVVNAMGVFDVASQRYDTDPDVAATAFGSVSNLIYVSSALRKENDQNKNIGLVGKGEQQDHSNEDEQHKKFSMQFMSVTDHFMDGVNLETFDELGEKGLRINTRLIKARKLRVWDPEQSLVATTSDSDGISVEEGLLKDLIED